MGNEKEVVIESTSHINDAIKGISDFSQF